jgi:hypothetical protein
MTASASSELDKLTKPKPARGGARDSEADREGVMRLEAAAEGWKFEAP